MTLTIPSDAFVFFTKLQNNNNREWFNTNKNEFKAIEHEIKMFFEQLASNMILHDDIEKVKVFRIYRDVRFSKNKNPYKTHFGGAFHRKRPQLRGGYYVHIEPNDCSFIAIGFWEPNKEDLHRIRQEFEIDANRIRDIMAEEKFKSTWSSLIGDELKSAPRGFGKTHKNIDLIRKKQFIFIKSYTDKAVLEDGFLKSIDDAFKASRPYLDYMSEILTSDLNGEPLF